MFINWKKMFVNGIKMFTYGKSVFINGKINVCKLDAHLSYSISFSACG